MPAIGTITISDGATTPVAHAFDPVGVVGSLATFADRSGGIPVGYGKISIAIREPQNGPNGVFKVSIKVMIPTLDTTSPSTSSGIQPAPTVGYTCACMMDWLLPARSSLQNRKDVFAFVKNLLNNSTVVAVVQNLESVY